MIPRSVTVPTLNDFPTSIDVNVPQPEEYKHDDISNVVLQTGVESAAENQIFRDKNVLKDSLVMYARQNNFELFIVYKSNNHEYDLSIKVNGEIGGSGHRGFVKQICLRCVTFVMIITTQ